VPAQYEPAGKEAAAVMVFQDGHTYVDEKGQFRVPVVFDNLIAAKEMPVTIGIFVNPGWFAEKLDAPQGWKAPEGIGSNRSVEYDSLGGDYAKFLETEILAEVGKTLRLTADPEQRAICGLSSGGICAFTVAWERPDLFRKVLSQVGSFTNIRGGNVSSVRDSENGTQAAARFPPGRLKGSDNEHGNWPLANQEMAAALKISWATTTNSSTAKAATAGITAGRFCPIPCAGSGARSRPGERSDLTPSHTTRGGSG